jgi:oxygen-independent coproporphyrinogen-3 oxidase
VHRRAPIVDYARALLQECDTVGAALPKGMQAGALHFGGGTPNLLAPGDLHVLVGALRRRFAFTAPFDFAVEIDPRVLTAEWIDTAAGLGMNRASIGVQDLNPVVQWTINRVQSRAEVARAVDRLRAAGVASVNLDLMYGLPRQSVATLLESIDQVRTLLPDRIALFGYAHVPRMKPHQRLLPDGELPDMAARLDQQTAAAEWIEKAGYVRIGLDHFALSTDNLAMAARQGRLKRNFQG